MTTEPLALIRRIRPTLHPLVRATVEAIVLSGSSIGSAETVADLLGLRNRFHLARLVRRNGMLPLHRFAGWVTVLSWIEAREQRGESLCSLAISSGRHPSACYRLVKEITGKSWGYVCEQGSGWILKQISSELERIRLEQAARM